MSESERAMAVAEPEEDEILVAELESEDCVTAPVPDEELPQEEPEGGATLLEEEAPADAALLEDDSQPSEAAEAATQAAREESEGAEPAFDRYSYLEPFVDPIASSLETTEVEDEQDIVLKFAGEPVAVSGWARGVVLGVLGSAEARDTSAYRIVESLALEAKIKEDLARIALFQQALDPSPVEADEESAESAGSAESDEEAAGSNKPMPPAHLRAELIHDVALGRTLMSELQRVIDSAVVNGNMDLAKSLSSFKPSLNHAINDARELLPAEDREEANAQAETLVRVPSDAELPEIRRRRRRRRRMQFSEDELAGSVVQEGKTLDKGNKRRTRILAAVFVASVLAWFALMLPRWMEEQQRVFTIDDFGRLPGVERVVARPPSLFVTLNSGIWNGLKEREQRDLVDEIAFSLSRAGYTGARFATSEGRTVAQWLKSRGVEMKAPPPQPESSTTP